MHPYDNLSPDKIISSVESLGLICDARLLALNSYENRVYQVGIENRDPLIAKFYRDNRSQQQPIDQLIEYVTRVRSYFFINLSTRLHQIIQDYVMVRRFMPCRSSISVLYTY